MRSVRLFSYWGTLTLVLVLACAQRGKSAKGPGPAISHGREPNDQAHQVLRRVREALDAAGFTEAHLETAERTTHHEQPRLWRVPALLGPEGTVWATRSEPAAPPQTHRVIVLFDFDKNELSLRDDEGMTWLFAQWAELRARAWKVMARLSELRLVRDHCQRVVSDGADGCEYGFLSIPHGCRAGMECPWEAYLARAEGSRVVWTTRFSLDEHSERVRVHVPVAERMSFGSTSFTKEGS